MITIGREAQPGRWHAPGWAKRKVQYGKRVVRALRGQDILQGRQTRCTREWLGAEGARWCICPRRLGPESIVYSFGIGDDISFDLALIHRFGVTVNAFDPTPRAAEWLAGCKLPDRFVVHGIGLAAFDGVATFSPPEDERHVSYSTVPRGAEGSLKAPVRRLSTILGELGHRELDLLKVDIEGGEYEALADIVRSEIPIRQLLVEFHHRWPEIGVRRTREAIASLNARNFRIFDVAPSGEEYSFIRLGSSGTSL